MRGSPAASASVVSASCDEGGGGAGKVCRIFAVRPLESRR